MEYTQPALLTEKLGLIKRLIYSKKLTIPVWRTRTARYTEPVQYTDYSEWSQMSLGESWVCHYDDARWLEASVTVPEDFAGKHLVLELNMGGEGMVTVNGEPKGSLAFYENPNCYGPSLPLRHRTRIELGALEAGKQLDISVQLNMNYKDYYKSGRYIKYDGTVKTTYRLASAVLCVVDDDTERFYFDVSNALDAARQLESPAETVLNNVQGRYLTQNFETILMSMNRDGALASKLTRAVLAALNVIPFYEGDDNMRRHMAQASAVLKEALEKLPAADRGYVYISGLAHLDIVWLWQEKHSVRKIANTVANTIELAQRYPEYVFTLSQPYAFQWLEVYYPELFQKLQEKVASGNIDPVGNLWVEMDCNLAGGESIVRQLLYGRAYYMEKFGKCSDIFLMPDSFGYNAALPQIIAKSGIKYFLSAKLHSNETYRFPHTLFRWEGLDGTRIPSYLMRNPYTSDINCMYLSTTHARMERKDLSDASCVTFGYGDGGGGPDYVMLENARRLTDMPGIPKAKMATLDEFFRAATVNEDQLPVWNDELYFDRHRGTYTTHAKVKKNNRKAELALRRTEMAASIRKICLGAEYPAQELEELWKMLLHLQFHDTLPGSSITPVYKDVEKEFAALFEKQEALFAAILSDLTAATEHEKDQQVLWNFLSWQRTASEQDGVVTVPSMGWTAQRQKASGLTVTEKLLENKFIRMELDEEGRIVSLILKENGRELMKKPGNVLLLFEDPTATYGAWDIYPEYMNKETVLRCDGVQSVQVGQAQGSVRLSWHFGKSTVTQELTIYSDTPRIDFITHVDWHEDMHMLKAAFYPNIRSSNASYEIQFGAIQRPTHRNTEYDAIRFEGCGHKWADLSQPDLGLSILNDCKYGYDILDDRMRITLLRSTMEPDYKADRGEHAFTYSLYPHAGTWQQGGTVHAGFELNEPVCSCIAEPKQAVVPQEFLSVDHASLVVDTFKQAEDGDGYILRLYESCGAGGHATVRFAKPIQSLSVCDLMEQNNEAVEFDGNSFRFQTSPYCIHTYRIRF